MTVAFRNRAPLASWIFMVVWMAALAGFSWHFVAGGLPKGQNPLWTTLAMTLFWAFGILGTVKVLRVPCVLVEVDDAGFFHVTWRYPFRSVKARLDPGTMRAEVRSDKDSDGDVSFRTVAMAPGHPEIVLAQGNSRAKCEDALASFDAIAVRRKAPGFR